MRFFAKRFLWSEPHFKSAIQNHEYYNNVVRISFAVPFKGRTEKSKLISGLQPLILSKSYFSGNKLFRAEAQLILAFHKSVG